MDDNPIAHKFASSIELWQFVYVNAENNKCSAASCFTSHAFCLCKWIQSHGIRHANGCRLIKQIRALFSAWTHVTRLTYVKKVFDSICQQKSTKPHHVQASNYVVFESEIEICAYIKKRCLNHLVCWWHEHCGALRCIFFVRVDYSVFY